LIVEIINFFGLDNICLLEHKKNVKLCGYFSQGI
jgi:hypothetical protein